MHFDCEANFKLLKLHKKIGQAVACLYLYLGLTGDISSLQKCKKNACIESMIPDSHNLISFEKHISVTIKHKLCLGLTESISLIFRNTKGRDRVLGVSKVIIQF